MNVTAWDSLDRYSVSYLKTSRRHLGNFRFNRHATLFFILKYSFSELTRYFHLIPIVVV